MEAGPVRPEPDEWESYRPYHWRVLGIGEQLGRRWYRPWSPLLLAYRIRHRLTGPQRGCSCSRCFGHPRRRVPAREIYHDRLRLAKVEEAVRKLGAGRELL